MTRREFEQTRFTYKEDEWGTPLELFRTLDEEFHFNLDPCGDSSRPLRKDLETWTKEDNGLNRSWAGRRVFVNPPYAHIAEWVQKCHAESESAEIIVLLIFSRTDTRYFHEYIYGKAELRFIRGRLKFTNLNNPSLPERPATFQSMLCIFKHDKTNQPSCRSIPTNLGAFQ